MQAAICFFVEFWPSLDERNASGDPVLISQLSVTDRPQDVHAVCIDLVQGTSICRLRVDNVRDNYMRCAVCIEVGLPPASYNAH